jgi:di/tricarboxylate transporter
LRAAGGLRSFSEVNGELLTIAALGLVLLGAVFRSVSLDVVAILAIALLVLGGVLGPTAALDGFGNTTLIVVAGMFVLADALQRTGAAQGIAHLVEASAARGNRAIFLSLLPVVMLLSGIMNNTGVVVLLLPLLLTAGQEAKISPSRLLMPLSYASITGGTLTLVGTTTTLLVDGMIRQADLPGLTFFEILPMGLAFCAVTFVYLTVAGPSLLPDRSGLTTPMTAETAREYMTEVFLRKSSRLAGKTLADFPRLRRRIRFLQLVRGEETHFPPFHDVVLQPDDMLLVKGSPSEIVTLLRRPGLEGPEGAKDETRIQSVDLTLAEVMIAPQSRLDQQTVSESRLRDRFGVTVLAVMRSGSHLRENLGSLHLRIGDILLVQGEPEAIARLARNERELVLLGGTPPPARAHHKAPLAVAVVAGALLLSATGLVSLPIAVLLGSILVVVGGCLSSSQAYRSIDLKIIVVLGCMLGVGKAASGTGLAGDVANGLVAFADQWGPRGILAAIYITTALLTELVTNAGTAAIMVPIAISAAEKAEVSHRPFVFAVALAASCSFLTPVGYQTNLLVYGPGGYRLQDYLRLGTPLVLVLWALATWLLPIMYPF